MNHQLTETNLWEYISKTASKETIVLVENWMQSDEFDADLFNETSKIYELSQESSSIEVDTKMAEENFFKQLEGHNSKTPPWKNVLKYAAIFAVLFFPCKYLFQIISTDTIVVLQTAYGEEKEFKLPDGSVVWLNSSSKLSYSKKDSRKLNLEGEGFFEVAKNKQIPFIVTTPDDLHIKALGTSFNIRSYPQLTTTETVLFTGLVEVTSTTQFSDTIQMIPSDKITFYKKNKSIQKSQSSYLEDIIAWKKGVISFEDATFKDISILLKTQLNIQVDFKNKKLSEYRFTGSFDKKTDIAEILETLKLTKEFNFKTLEKNKWLVY